MKTIIWAEATPICLATRIKLGVSDADVAAYAESFVCKTPDVEKFYSKNSEFWTFYTEKNVPSYVLNLCCGAVE